MPATGVVFSPAVVPLVVPAAVAVAPLALEGCSSVPTAVVFVPASMCVTASAWAITRIRSTVVVAAAVVPTVVVPAAIVMPAVARPVAPPVATITAPTVVVLSVVPVVVVAAGVVTTVVVVVPVFVKPFVPAVILC